jgi:hypothetical protein
MIHTMQSTMKLELYWYRLSLFPDQVSECNKQWPDEPLVLAATWRRIVLSHMWRCEDDLDLHFTPWLAIEKCKHEEHAKYC